MPPKAFGVSTTKLNKKILTFNLDEIIMTVLDFNSPTFAGLSPIMNIDTPMSIGTSHFAGTLTINSAHSPLALNFGDPLLGTPATIAITPLQSSYQLTVGQRVSQYERAINIAEEDSIVRVLNFANDAEDSPVSNISSDLEAEDSDVLSEDSDVSSSVESLQSVLEQEVSPLHLSEFDSEEMEIDSGSTTSESSDDGSFKRSRSSDDEEDSSSKKARSDEPEEDSGYIGLTNQELTDIADFSDQIFASPGSDFYVLSPENAAKIELSGENDSPFPYLTEGDA
jgi:hypothetical protein